MPVRSSGGAPYKKRKYLEVISVEEKENLVAGSIWWPDIRAD
jgi:hypothetical protein